MGLFTQKPQEPSAWAALPGEPLDEDRTDRLDETPDVDLLGVGIGSAVTSVSLPIAAPEPESDPQNERE